MLWIDGGARRAAEARRLAAGEGRLRAAGHQGEYIRTYVIILCIDVYTLYIYIYIYIYTLEGPGGPEIQPPSADVIRRRK